MKPARSRAYLAFVRSQPCAICHTTRYVAAAHTGPHGIGQKSPDFTAIPLCEAHHLTGRHSYHQMGPQAFQAHHQIEIHKIVAGLVEAYMVRLEDNS